MGWCSSSSSLVKAIHPRTAMTSLMRWDGKFLPFSLFWVVLRLLRPRNFDWFWGIYAGTVGG